MELIPPNTHIDFIGKKKYTVWISAVAILISLGSIFLHGGLKYGVDFAGGLLIQIRFSKAVDICRGSKHHGSHGFERSQCAEFRWRE